MDRYLSLIQELRKVCPGLELRENELMSRHTTFRIGGPARLMALPVTEEEAEAAVRCARDWASPHFIWATEATFWWRTGDTTGLS